jgi:hypothetical protein
MKNIVQNNPTLKCAKIACAALRHMQSIPPQSGVMPCGSHRYRGDGGTLPTVAAARLSAAPLIDYFLNKVQSLRWWCHIVLIFNILQG